MEKNNRSIFNAGTKWYCTTPDGVIHGPYRSRQEAVELLQLFLEHAATARHDAEPDDTPVPSTR